MDTYEIIKVLQAYQSGAKIQKRRAGCRDNDSEWENVQAPAWNFALYDYRVQPGLIVIYANTRFSNDGFEHVVSYQNRSPFRGLHSSNGYARTNVKLVEERTS